MRLSSASGACAPSDLNLACTYCTCTAFRSGTPADRLEDVLWLSRTRTFEVTPTDLVVSSRPGAASSKLSQIGLVLAELLVPLRLHCVSLFLARSGDSLFGAVELTET